MKELTVEVGFTTDCMGEVSSIKLEFSDKDLVQIRKSQAYLEENTDIFKVVMYFDGELLDEEGKESDFRTDGGELFIFKDRLYYFTQSKHDASIQIESAEIQMSQLFTKDELVLSKSNPVVEAREVLRKEGYFVQNLWTSEDIIHTGNEMDIEISEAQALEIMELMGRRVDASIGVNWDFIECIIDEYFSK
jgi:hypothetical protein